MTGDEEPRSPVEAFAVLGHEVRLSVLRVLADHLSSHPDDPGLAFAELRERVGVRDAGNFSYHLDKLRDRFVTKSDGRYEPTYAGLAVVSAVLSGTYTDREETMATETDRECPMCDEPITATYENELLQWTCPEHGTVLGTAVPVGALEGRTFEDLLELAERKLRMEVELATAGVCPMCFGAIETTMPPTDHRGSTDHAMAAFECDRCWVQFHAPVGVSVVSHPAVISFCHERGVNLRSRNFLDLGFVVGPDSTTLVSTDPPRAEIEIEMDGDTLAVTIGADASITAIEEG